MGILAKVVIPSLLDLQVVVQCQGHIMIGGPLSISLKSVPNIE